MRALVREGTAFGPLGGKGKGVAAVETPQQVFVIMLYPFITNTSRIAMF